MSKLEIGRGRKVLVWVWLVISSLFIWLTPIITAWFFLVDESTKVSKGNGVFWFVAIPIVLMALKAFERMVRKQRANGFKHTVLLTVGLAKFVVFVFIINTAAIHIDDLHIAIAITGTGFTIGKLIHIILSHKYKEYLKEIEVL